MREVLLVLILGWVCVFILGFLKNNPIFSISLTVVYQTAAMMIPRMLAGRWHPKYDVLDTFHTGSRIFLSALITSCVLYALGRLAHRIMEKRKHARLP